MCSLFPQGRTTRKLGCPVYDARTVFMGMVLVDVGTVWLKLTCGITRAIS